MISAPRYFAPCQGLAGQEHNEHNHFDDQISRGAVRCWKLGAGRGTMHNDWGQGGALCIMIDCSFTAVADLQRAFARSDHLSSFVA